MPTHGSLSKGGKVRKLSPKEFREIEVQEKYAKIKKKMWHRKKHKSPRIKNRRKYELYLLGKYPKNTQR